MKHRASWQGGARHLALSRRSTGVLLCMVLGAVGVETVLYARGLLDHVGVALLCGVSLLVFVGYYLGLLAVQAFKRHRRPSTHRYTGPAMPLEPGPHEPVLPPPDAEAVREFCKQHTAGLQQALRATASPRSRPPEINW